MEGRTIALKGLSVAQLASRIVTVARSADTPANAEQLLGVSVGMEPSTKWISRKTALEK